MPGWPSRLLNGSSGPSSSRRAPSPDSLYDGDFDLPDIPIPFPAPERRGSAAKPLPHGSSPPRSSTNPPRPKAHMHTGSDRAVNGTRQKRPVQNVFEARSYPSTSDGFMQERGSVRTRAGKVPVDDRNMDAGSCGTCDTKVRWPKGVSEFRCGTCLMVNDIKPVAHRNRSSRDPAQHVNQSAPSSAPTPSAQNQGMLALLEFELSGLPIIRAVRTHHRRANNEYRWPLHRHVSGSIPSRPCTYQSYALQVSP